MSYFDFINEGSTHPQQKRTDGDSSASIPVSVVDSLFTSQMFNPDTERPSPHISTSTTMGYNKDAGPFDSRSFSSLTSKSTTPNMFGIQAAKEGSPQHTGDSLARSSVFDFINQSSKSDLPSLDDLVFTSSSRSYGTDTAFPSFSYLYNPKSTDLASSSSSKSRQTVEMQWVSEEAKWKRAEVDQQHQQNRIQQLYDQRSLMLDEIKRMDGSLSDYLARKQLALKAEDYENLDALDKLIRQQTSKRDQLMHTILETFPLQLQAEWKAVVDKSRQVANCASAAAQAYQVYKDERHKQFKQYDLDMQRAHERLACEIKDERSKLESNKSELAFDLNYWKQAETQLDEKMAESVHDRQFKKEELVTMIDSIDDEIQELVEKLASLKQTRSEYAKETEKLEQLIEQDLACYQPEVTALKKDRLEIEAKKRDLERQSLALDEKNGVLQQKMQQKNQYDDGEWKELEGLDKSITKATETSHIMTKKADFIFTVIDECITSRDQSIKDQLLLLKRSLDAIDDLRRDVDQQEHDYNISQQRMDELDTRLNMQQLQRAKMEQRKSKAVEQGHYQQAGKWQQELKQLDASLDHDWRSHAEVEIQVHSLDTTLTTSRRALQELCSDHIVKERKSVETIISILKDSLTTLSLYPRTADTAGIIDHEVDLMTNLLSHYERCKSASELSE